MDSTDIVVRDATIPAELSVDDVRGQVQKIQALMRDLMHEGEHYGVIPGTGSKKTLLKPGAEKLCFTFRLAPYYEVAERDLPDLGGGPHREYRVTVTLKKIGDDTVLGQGVGSCSTMEKKYRYRKTRDERYENPDLADTYNTVLKMAKKRALVDATITACAASDIFTQDVEDFVEDHHAPEMRDVTPNDPRAEEAEVMAEWAQLLESGTIPPDEASKMHKWLGQGGHSPAKLRKALEHARAKAVA